MHMLDICYLGSLMPRIWRMSVNKWHVQIFTCALRSGIEVDRNCHILSPQHMGMNFVLAPIICTLDSLVTCPLRSS
ncbi:hypothetical protein BDA96_06G000500 [Sorghum bicolor]|uniref:Uncharacterized protein n=2 Tax=Sorghum bicolor TaxID=4558 RepID=A0A921QML4_SORBI|nr:hypothetical protein BDA96_06G000500 [Sorghum bicolor]KXG25743.1 hypothetical protein SORBI_3006G000300 [Sorghum bicolor]